MNTEIAIRSQQMGLMADMGRFDMSTRKVKEAMALIAELETHVPTEDELELRGFVHKGNCR